MVVLLVAIPLSVALWRRGLAWWKVPPVVTFSSLDAPVLLVVVLIEVTVRLLAGDGASAPTPVIPRALSPRRREPPLGLGWPVRPLD